MSYIKIYLSRQLIKLSNMKIFIFFISNWRTFMYSYFTSREGENTFEHKRFYKKMFITTCFACSFFMVHLPR